MIEEGARQQILASLLDQLARVPLFCIRASHPDAAGGRPTSSTSAANLLPSRSSCTRCYRSTKAGLEKVLAGHEPRMAPREYASPWSGRAR